MKLLVYTCVIGGYDRVFPPVNPHPGTDHVIVTDDPDMKVPGWMTHVIEPAAFGSPSLANRYHKMLMHRVWPGYDMSVYVDGNIRLLKNMSSFVAETHQAQNALTLFRHDRRNSTLEEIETCAAIGKLGDPTLARARLDQFRKEGFPDDLGLVEAGILIKNHQHPLTDMAMSAWWEEYVVAPTRDQLSLPYVLWRTRAPVAYHDFNYRQPNPWFGVYPHRGAKGMTPAYADLRARAYDSSLHRLALLGWDMTRWLRRNLRVQNP